MTIEYLKRGKPEADRAEEDAKVRATVEAILKDIDYQSTRAKGYGFMIETAYRVWQHGGRISESPIAFTDRVRGYSKMTLTVAAEELLLVTWWGVRDRVVRPLRRLVTRSG